MTAGATVTARSQVPMPGSRSLAQETSVSLMVVGMVTPSFV